VSARAGPVSCLQARSLRPVNSTINGYSSVVRPLIGPVNGIRYLKSFEGSSTDPHWLRAHLAVHRAQRAALLAAGSPRYMKARTSPLCCPTGAT
jgi:hypothetical protein